VRLLLGLVGAGRGAGLLGLGFLGGNVALGLGLVLLGLALALAVLVAGDAAGDLFGLALHVLDDAFHCGAGSGLFITHGVTPSFTRCLCCRTRSIPGVAPTQSRTAPGLV
jgi:hypothetical protein